MKMEERNSTIKACKIQGYVSKCIIIISISMALIQAVSGVVVGYDKTVYPGEWVNLSGPTPPAGVTYVYEWHVQTPQGGAELTLRNATSSNVQKTVKDLKFYAPYYGSDTVLYINLLVAAMKTGGDPLSGCSESAPQKTVLITAPTDYDLTGDTGDHCTSIASTYTFTPSRPGLTYEWYLGPVATNPATNPITSFTGGITPASVTSTTSSITVNWDSLQPALQDSGGQQIPPHSGTFTVSFKIKEAGVVKQTISKTVNLVPKPTPGISVE